MKRAIDSNFEASLRNAVKYASFFYSVRVENRLQVSRWINLQTLEALFAL
jgi:hypothetical protein